jgi:thioredoxin 1
MKPLLRKILIVALLIVAVVVTINLKGSKAISQKQQNLEVVGTELPKESTPVSIINEAGLPRFLELGADKCVPCKMMQPVLEELRREYPGKLQVDFVDVWKDPTQSQKYGILGIPTQILFDTHGNEVFRHSGFFPKDQILKKFEELGIALNKED